tara:strand:+ start:122 stop:349 length:228 start_codon:yes stop_codon:yes gene_type:complete
MNKRKEETMFKNIDLNRLNKKELTILLKALDNYADKESDTYYKDKAKNYQSNKLSDRLKSYGDKICEVIQNKYPE